MQLISNFLVAAAVAAVATVLFMGLLNLLLEGSSSRSQLLMRWRIGLQFMAIVIIMGVLWLRA
jgi:hypothetical protein